MYSYDSVTMLTVARLRAACRRAGSASDETQEERARAQEGHRERRYRSRYVTEFHKLRMIFFLYLYMFKKIF